jgi:hypothetical protein
MSREVPRSLFLRSIFGLLPGSSIILYELLLSALKKAREEFDFVWSTL